MSCILLLHPERLRCQGLRELLELPRVKRPTSVGIIRTPKAQQYRRQLKSVGRRLALLRDEARETTEQFAAGLGVSPETVRKWIKGVSWPSAESLVLIAADYGRSVDWILGIEPGSMHPLERSLEEERAVTIQMGLALSRRLKREAERARHEPPQSPMGAAARLRLAARAIDRVERGRRK